MVSIARKSCLALALAALALAVNTLPAQATPAPQLGYSAIAAGTTMAKACAAATALVADHCSVHGAISTNPGRCTDVYDPWSGEYMTTICDCTASTGLCANFRPPTFPG